MVQEAFFSTHTVNISIGIANINSMAGDLENNKQKIIKALDYFSRAGVNLVIFPEYCLSGYFWEPENNCRSYMETACMDHMKDWLDDVIESYINDTLKYIVLNGLLMNSRVPGKYFNTSIVLDHTRRYFEKDRSYRKTFIPGFEKPYVTSGKNDYLVLETQWGNFGFLTCYDICFPQFTQNLVYEKGADALIVNAVWRKQGKREYKGLNISESFYYQRQWNMIITAIALQNQIWVMAANAVGSHSIDELNFCGCSGIWAPSGINQIKGSDIKEELIILHHIDMIGENMKERMEYDYTEDFRDIKNSDP